MILLDNNIAILCGALADEAARERAGQGIFTQALIERLSADPALLTLPFDLEAWQRALPENLLASQGIEILDKRETFVNRVQDNNRSGQNPTHDRQTAQAT